MASPNLINANLILGKTTGILLSNTSVLQVLNNPSSSGKTLKLNTVIATNKSGAIVTFSLNWYSAASLTGTEYPIVSNVSIPVSTSLNIIDKSSQYYLEENTSLGAYNSSSNAIVVTASYEDIS
jgi:hypothetical protein